MKIHYMPQGSQEWFDIRKLKLTASHATAIGNNGKGLDTYCDEIVLEAIAPKEPYTNADIERGNELEQIARTTYEFTNDVQIEQVGFIEHNPFVGCSPDGLLSDGGIEIKARNNKIHYSLLKNDDVDSSVIWQMNMCMLISERGWWDFCSYNPNFKQSLYIKRFYADQSIFDKLLKGFETGERKIKEILSLDVIKNELNNR